MKVEGLSRSARVAVSFLLSISLSISLLLEKRTETLDSNYEIILRRTASLQTLIYAVSNYATAVSAEEMASFRQDYPSNPATGEWQRFQEVWGENADGIRDTHWLTLPTDEAQGLLSSVVKFAQEHKGEYSDIVVIGMGGSSRPADVIRGVLGTKEGFARIHVMENLDQEDIQRVLSAIDISKTLFISISKSGGTAETMALTQIAYQKILDTGADPAKHFIAITTTSRTASPLMQFLSSNNVPQENIFEHPDLVGGRYTLFSVIGLLPAALAGHDIEAILASARRAMDSDAKFVLGKFMADMEQEGRIYMRVILPKELLAIGPWIEQLVAESQGKIDINGRERGILPILERDYDPSIYTLETFAFRIKIGTHDANDSFVRQITEESGVPVWEFTVNSPEDALGLLYALEFATGMSGIMMGVQPFDQPGVEAGKRATNDMKAAMLAEIQRRGISAQEAYEEELGKYRSQHRIKIADGVYFDYGTFIDSMGEKGEADLIAFAMNKGIIHTIPANFGTGEGHVITQVWITPPVYPGLESLSASQLYALLLLYAQERVGKTYAAILPYAVDIPARTEVWKVARAASRQFGMQDLFGIGPLYEHSYRQYFMQGHNKGIFVFIVPTDSGIQVIPGESIPGFTTGMQNVLQALGTQQALVGSGRYALRIEVEGSLSEEKLAVLQRFFAEVLP